MIRNLLFFISLFISFSSVTVAYGQTSPATPQELPKYTTPSTSTTSVQTLANQALLPNDFAVYTNGTSVVNQPLSGYSKRTLPTNNDYNQTPGCYVICYSHSNTPTAVYAVSPDIFVYGQVRVPGSYQGRICKPTGYENIDISGDPAFKTLCNTKLITCQNKDCWAGGDTGGWFGM